VVHAREQGQVRGVELWQQLSGEHVRQLVEETREERKLRRRHAACTLLSLVVERARAMI
jgi:hypothetical protein